MSHLKRLLRPLVIPCLACLALTDTGCASSIAARFPHLERRAVCARPLEIEQDAAEYLITEDGVAISNLHPEVVDRVAPTARVVYEVDGDADPSSLKYLPAPYNELTCPERYTPLLSRDMLTAERLPEASIDLLVHEQQPEPVSKAIAEKLASCAKQNRSELDSNQYTMTFNVFVKDDGQATFAFLVESTLGDRPIERCIAEVLRNAQWPAVAANLVAAREPGLRPPVVEFAPIGVPVGGKSFFAQPAPNQPPPSVGDRPSGVYKIQPQPAPAGNPAGGGPRVPPSVFVIPLSPVLAGVAAFGFVFFYSSNDAPAWASEMNPMTAKPYTSRQEYDEVQGRAAQKLLKRSPLHITAVLPKPPPAPAPPAPAPPPAHAPPPALTPQQQREQEKKREKCAKIAKQIKEIIEVKRKETPKGGLPQGRQGIAHRWSEIAENKGKWLPQPDGSPSKAMRGHLTAYAAGQKELKTELDKWDAKDTGCDDTIHGLPANARQYAAQTPEYGPGKPLEPAPLPEYRPPPVAPVIVPPSTKGSK